MSVDRILLLPDRLRPAAAGPVLRSYREMSDIMQKTMAEKLGVTPDTLRRWEMRRSPFLADQMIKFANNMDLEVVLFDRKEYESIYGERDKINASRIQLANMGIA